MLGSDATGAAAAISFAGWHGKEILVLAMCFCGDIGAGRSSAKLRSIGKPIADVVGLHPFTGWQQALDPLLTPCRTTGKVMISRNCRTQRLQF